DFARENIGAGVARNSRHYGVLQDLRVGCMLRKNALVRRGVTPIVVERPATPVPTTARTPKSMTTAELAEAAGKERGPKLQLVIRELGQRKGDDALAALAVAAADYDTETRQLARDLLQKSLARLTAAELKAKLNDEKVEIRMAAVRV